MTPATFANAFILTGPTGSGKTQLAVELAQRLGAEIVSMDSMAIFRGMDIGTAKPTLEERRAVPHHLIDVLEPWQSSSVAWWLERAAKCCREIEGRGRRVLFVGGTPLYLKALLYGLFKGPSADPVLRGRLAEEAERTGAEGLHRRLAEIDPAAANRLHPNDLRRVIRALEVWELTGKPISHWQQEWKASLVDRKSEERAPGNQAVPRCLWLDMPRTELYARINARVLQMMANGLEAEARSLRNLPYPLSREAAQALGYKEIFDYLDGRVGRAEAIRRIQTRSRNFAKRQITWFRHLPECRPVPRELTFSSWGLRM